MIRCAVLKDIPAIMGLAREFYQETDYTKFATFDEDTVQDLTESIILNGICVIATDESDTPVGVLGFILSPFVFNRNVLSCVEAIWLMKKEHRGSGEGVKMIQYADQIRKLRGARHFQLARLNTSPDGLDDVLEKLGFTFSEKYFSKVD